MTNHHYTKYDASVPGHVFDADRARADFAKGRHYMDGYVVRWSSNDSVPPADLLEDWYRADCIDMATLRMSVKARDAEVAAFCAEYRRRQPAQPSAEELFEMRAAFGEGAEVVNVISGRRVRL
jgi:hypothetical protein